MTQRSLFDVASEAAEDAPPSVESIIAKARRGARDWTLTVGDSRDVLATWPDACVDAVVCDPPYELGFMGKKWDASGIAFDVGLWRAVLRVLKPGGHLLAFSGTRTQHRMVCAIEDAGFEVRDQIGWAYGCLDTETHAVTSSGVTPYNKIKAGDPVLCYNVRTGGYSFQPVQEVVTYDYADTAFRLVGDFGEQVVSRNHRVIVERGGVETFVFAEEAAREQFARVPVLEGLPALLNAIHGKHKGAGGAQQDLQHGVQESVDRRSEQRGDGAQGPQVCVHQVCDVRQGGMAPVGVAGSRQITSMQQEVQRHPSWADTGGARAQGPQRMDGGEHGVIPGQDDGAGEPRVAGWVDVPQAQGCIRGPAHQVCAMSAEVPEHGEGGRIRDGAPPEGCCCTWARAGTDGGCPPHQPRCDGQQNVQPGAFQDKRGTQEIRAWGGHSTTMVRVVPFEHTGTVWCLRVPTGAFVAVRGGVAFPTGNSGFPKSLDVSKAIDKAAGATREVVGHYTVTRDMRGGSWSDLHGKANNATQHTITAPATDAARQWSGWGTALKPAWEPVCVARKPLTGTVAENVQAHGTGAINVDACRVGTDLPRPALEHTGRTGNVYGAGLEGSRSIGDTMLGRWPANIIHDGSDEVGALLGDAARFFYCAKAARSEREHGLDALPAVRGHDAVDRAEGSAGLGPRAGAGRSSSIVRNIHPTVKPVDLMRHLVTLVTPPGGIVLDPFAGSGSTGIGALLAGCRFRGIELDTAHACIAWHRMRWWDASIAASAHGVIR